MRTACLLLLVACGSSSPPTPSDPIANTATPDAAPPRTSPTGPGHCAAPAGRLRGCVHDEHGEPLAGATVVVTSPGEPGPMSAITDEHGGWAIEVDGEVLDLDTYYDDLVVHQVVHVGVDPQPIDTPIDLTQAGGEVIEIR